MNDIILEDTDKPLIHYDVDKLLFGDESRKVNDFYGIYKLSILSIGSSGSGKTSFLINQLLNGVYDVNVIILFIPEETLNSGLYKSLLNKNILPGIKFIVSNLSKDDGEVNKLNDNVIIYNRFLTFDDVYEIKRDYVKRTKINKPFLLVFDDFISLFDKKKWLQFYEFLFNSSRLNSYIYCCVQSIKEIPPLIRTNFTIIILFINYLSVSVCKTMLTNSIPLDLTKRNIDDLIYMCKHSDNKHEPLILVGSTCPRDKKIIYMNKYIIFD